MLSRQEEIDFLSIVSDRHDKPFHVQFFPGRAQVLDSLPPTWNELPVTLLLAEQQLLLAANAMTINGKHCVADVHFFGSEYSLRLN